MFEASLPPYMNRQTIALYGPAVCATAVPSVARFSANGAAAAPTDPETTEAVRRNLRREALWFVMVGVLVISGSGSPATPSTGRPRGRRDRAWPRRSPPGWSARA